MHHTCRRDRRVHSSLSLLLHVKESISESESILLFILLTRLQCKVRNGLEMRVKVAHRGLTNPVAPVAHAHCNGQSTHRKLLFISNDRDTSFIVDIMI